LGVFATIATACPVAPPLVQPSSFDSAPFYFPDGLDPNPDEDVIVQLNQLDRVELSADIYDWDEGDTLEYVWTLRRGDLSTQSTGVLRSPTFIDGVYAYRVFPQAIESCGLLLNQENDVVTVRLEIIDTIPESQRFNPSADSYRIVISWRIVARGNCI